MDHEIRLIDKSVRLTSYSYLVFRYLCYAGDDNYEFFKRF